MFSAQVSKHPVFLDKARDLGDRLLRAFDSPSGLPYNQIHLQTGAGTGTGWAGGVRDPDWRGFSCVCVHVYVYMCMCTCVWVLSDLASRRRAQGRVC